ncbi:hybrid sensor histidine kinase/response regulator [Haliangium ochraceum]|uniref:histidine kinase n=1 Tax=Haliangium ochraceum (strain DSM 14365 / JCM 11303 / SMP-2) TaxID=502025 RepID=D0LZ10_HALO1|nr:PAS domain-containing hybrid sensor histidine kinase/response regulator [Haliangium ochraceum]ACY14480.1 PAS/PAC sensor hybrid histidine kinase [Haliangium ochraceum DSM 14365]
MRSSISQELTAAYELLAHPLWVFDVETLSMVWANQPGLRMWRADDLDELLARDYAADISEAAQRRLMGTLHRCLQGERIRERWTLYPLEDTPVTVDCGLAAVPLEDGRTALLISGMPVQASEIAAENQRGLETLRHLPLAVSRFDAGGALVFQNPAAASAFGPEDGPHARLLERFADREHGAAALREARAGAIVRTQTRLRTGAGERWHDVELRQGRDPVTGKPLLLFMAGDISELKQAEAELRAAKEQAEAAARVKSEFLATISHEMRTPLHGIIGFGDLLAHSHLDPQQRGFLDSLRESARLLFRLISDVLDLAQIEAGRMHFEDRAMDLEALIARVRDVIAFQAAEKRLVLEAQLDPELPRHLRGDALRIEQVLVNLLGNALKFTPAGRVSLRVRCVPECAGEDALECASAAGRCLGDVHRLRFEVRDTGVGISSDRLNILFEPFTQLDTSASRAIGGSGLGLAICKRLVEGMGGVIGVASTPGKGSCFWFELSLAAADTARAPAAEREGGAGASGTSEAEAEAESRLHVLVVDDNALNQTLARTLLQRRGHRVTVAENGQQAVALVARGSFDAVLMDVHMPTMDGLAATRAIRAMGLSASQLPIVGLTASVVNDNREEYLASGMNDCIGKPFRVAELFAVLSRQRR